MSSFNKATAAAIAGAVATLAAAFVPMGAELQGAVHTVLTAFFVWLIPNIKE